LEHFEGIESYSVKHLPIVKAYADRLGLVELINHLVPSEMDLSPGVYFLGMVLDTLSGRNPLYRLEQFFEDQDTELLLGKEVEAKSFNDVNVGRWQLGKLIRAQYVLPALPRLNKCKNGFNWAGGVNMGHSAERGKTDVFTHFSLGLFWVNQAGTEWYKHFRTGFTG
jgi:Domain of unknown function (DUF4277)